MPACSIARTAITSSPAISLGFDTNTDPAAAMFNTRIHVGDHGQLAKARALYALLTGRVPSIPGRRGSIRRPASTSTRRPGAEVEAVQLRGVPVGPWRVRPTLTLNGGIRWDLQFPFTPADRPGRRRRLRTCAAFPASAADLAAVRATCSSRTRSREALSRLTQSTSWESLTRRAGTTSANVGVAWRPNVQDGFLQ